MIKRYKISFTLIELVVAISLVAIMTAFGTTLVVTLLRGYEDTRRNVEVVQQVQTALARIRKELLTQGADPTRSNNRTIEFEGPDAHAATIAWGGPSDPVLRLDGVTLLEEVDSFSVQEDNQTDVITVELEVSSASNTFVLSTYPRD